MQCCALDLVWEQCWQHTDGFCCCWVMFVLSQELFTFSGPASERAGGAWETGRGYSQDSWPEPAKEVFHWHYGICLPEAPLHVLEPCFPGDGRAPACPWEAVHGSLVLLCLRARLLLYLLNCSYLNPRVLHPFPILLWVRGSEQVSAWCLVAGQG